jgi:uncharacterized small protein (TIGR04563 family)
MAEPGVGGRTNFNLSRHRKQSLYFPDSMLRELEREARRIDRSLSWIVQRCLRERMPEIRRLRAATASVAEPERGEVEQKSARPVQRTER